MDYENSDFLEASFLPFLFLPSIYVGVGIGVCTCVGVVIRAGVVIVDHNIYHVVYCVVDDLGEDEGGS